MEYLHPVGITAHFDLFPAVFRGPSTHPEHVIFTRGHSLYIFSTLPFKKKALLSAQTTFNLKCKQVALCFANVNQVKVESNQKYNY